mmetsp:Transcript_32116/g.51456  ORF Transcript_32116/g.51456 Transcript_32116/m.51456 type:complete len:250 (-) Transcript_32116:1329-2078(-)
MCLSGTASSNGTDCKNLRYTERCFSVCSCRTLLKVLPSAPQTPEASLAVIVAVLGHLYNKANAPKDPPELIESRVFPSTETSRVPLCVTKKWLPSSPSLTTTSPASNLKYCIVRKIMSTSLLSSNIVILSCFIAAMMSSRVCKPFSRSTSYSSKCSSPVRICLASPFLASSLWWFVGAVGCRPNAIPGNDPPNKLFLSSLRTSSAARRSFRLPSLRVVDNLDFATLFRIDSRGFVLKIDALLLARIEAL